jgi:WD40 repeat protein
VLPLACKWPARPPPRPPCPHPLPRPRSLPPALPPKVCFSPDGRWVLSASFDKSIKLWDGAKGTFVATFRGHVGPVYQVAWSSDSRLFVSGSKDSTLKASVRGGGGTGRAWGGRS